MYDVFGKSRHVERNFENLLQNLDLSEKKKLMTTLAKAPKLLPPNLSLPEQFGRVEKKHKRFWQYYAPDGCRIIYEVKDRPKQVIIQFAGNHDEAGTFLRQNR